MAAPLFTFRDRISKISESVLCHRHSTAIALGGTFRERIVELSDMLLSLHRYLGTLFSTEMKPEEKFSLLEKEYGPVDENMEKEVREMCNLSDMLVEEERIKLAKEMLADGKPDEEILKYSKVSKEMLADLKKELFQ